MNDFCPFNSRDKRHKSLFGATAAGQYLWLSVVMPRIMGVSHVWLVEGSDDRPYEYHDLTWKSTDGSTEWWSIEFKFSEPDVYFYYFEYETPFGNGKIFKVDSSMGGFAPDGAKWQQTVYDPESKVSSKLKGAVMYQIFPDRFRRSGIKHKNVPKDRVFHENISDVPEFTENETYHRWNADFFGGDLEGIREKLGYISKFGVNVLYLNPIFESNSNHRYNTGNYMKIDPALGTEEDFIKLCRDAKKIGISVVLDGVFNHTGDDSVYFNKFGRYKDVGAYQSKDSEYFGWYNFKNWPDEYSSWWGIKDLPEVNEENESYVDFITGENGVIHKWMSLGASGFRLDVADELPDFFIEKIRKAIKREDPDGIIIGEVWEDASNKISYGKRRKYFEGSELDSTMNYPFRNAVINFLAGGTAEQFAESVMTICENYPPDNLNSAMNILSTHDTERILSVLGGITVNGRDRFWQSKQKLSDEQRRKAEKLLKAAYVLIYTLPGFPCVYYGDETYMEGMTDPFNRRFFPWGKEDTDLSELLRLLGWIRSNRNCLKDGVFICRSAMLGCVCYERVSGDDSIMVIVNANPDNITYDLPPDWYGCYSVTGEITYEKAVEIPGYSGTVLFK